MWQAFIQCKRRRGSKKDFRQFLIIAFASGAELETQIELAKNLNFVTSIESADCESLLLEVMKMLNKMISQMAS
jgi:four helix bundle protein